MCPTGSDRSFPHGPGTPDLARLWCNSGSSNDPRSLLEPILAAIEGGETTRDVGNAGALLAEIA